MSWQPDGWQQDGWQPDGWQPDDSGVFTPSPRTYFRARREQKVFPVKLMPTENEYIFDPVDKDPAGARKVVLDLFAICANFWRPNEQYSAGEFIRPNRANGFAYECTTAGTSNFREPSSWPRVIGVTQTDGSVTWTCRAAGSNGLAPVTSPTVACDISASVSVEESTKLLPEYGIGGTDGEDYDAVFTFTLDGVTRVARQTVRVRKQ